jgi:hypothetical protein
MDPESPILRFAEFYFSPLLSRKGVELLKLDLAKTGSSSTEDPRLNELRALRKLSALMGKRKKALLTDEELRASLSPAHLELYSLTPEEALLLSIDAPFRIPIESLSLAFGHPEASLRFRHRHLLHRFDESGTRFIDPGQENAHRGTVTLTPVTGGASAPGWLESFRSLPLGLRFTIESGVILSGLLALLWIIPEVRNRYENSIQKRINDYLIESSLLDAPAPEGTSKAPRQATEGKEEGVEESEPSAPARSSSEEPSARKQPKVNEGETWRFSFTGSSTHEIESGILEALRSISVETKPLTVPGGIQFDFMLPVSQLIPLKGRLETLVFSLQSKTGPGKSASGGGVNLSWYKKKNMGTRRIPDAHVQVIVWISTL